MTDNTGIIYPVGTKEVFNSLWYIASGFGERRSSTWYHSGDDINLKTGGNTDLNQDLFAIADGEILTTRYKTTGFGNTLTMKFLLNGRTFYALYAHLNGFNSKAGDIVKKGERICRLGNSGNSSLAHLHFSIKNTANGIDNIPNNPTELKQWENPLKFTQENYSDGISNQPMQTNELLKHIGVKTEQEGIMVWDREMGFLKSEREKNTTLKGEKEQLEKIFVERREALAKNLGTVNSWDEIILASSRFRGLDDKNRELEDKLERQQKEHAEEIATYKSRLEALKLEMGDLRDKHSRQIENLENRVTKEIEELTKVQEEYKTVSRLIKWVQSLFERK